MIKGRGQYALNASNKDFHPSLLSPKNSFGGSVTFKINDNFGIEAGMDYVYHMGKWEPVCYIRPVFYSKKNR
ncbi:hypothetical protein AwDysgo_02590 [Bacteroidales bacterium]|nr:hypothetical protein AwDysgo_02590 [Bacteroidales bacterium]